MLDEKSILDVEGARERSCPKCSGTEWYLKPAEYRKSRAVLVCLTCKRERWKRYYKAHRSQILKKNKKWFQENPKKRESHLKRWYKKRRAARRAQKR